MNNLSNLIKLGIIQLKNLSVDHHILVKGSGQSFVIKILSLVIGFALQVLLARVLKVEEFGMYMYVLAWVNILTLVGKFGLDQAAKKFLPVYQANNDQNKLAGFILYSFKKVLYISLMLGFVIILITYLLKDKIGVDLFIVFVAGAALLLINSQLQLIGSFLEALKKIIPGQLPRNIIRPVLLGLGVVVLIFINKPNATAAMIVNIIATALALAVIVFYLLKYINLQTNHHPIDSDWLNTAFPLLLTSGVHLMLTQTDIILLGYLRNTDLAGIYSSVSRISQLVLFGLTAVNIITAPLISELYVEKNFKKLQEMVSFSALLTLVLTMPVIVIIALITPFILNIFGPEFVTGSTALRIILLGQVINALSGSISFIMTMTKFHKQSLYILTLAAIINLVLNVFLIPLFGLEGAAATTAITTVFWNVTMYFYIRNNLDIDSSIIGFLKK